MLQALHNTENLCKHGTFHKANRYPTVFFYRCFKEGEKISAGDVLCEIQTDKVSSIFAQSSPHGFKQYLFMPQGEELYNALLRNKYTLASLIPLGAKSFPYPYYLFTFLAKLFSQRYKTKILKKKCRSINEWEYAMANFKFTIAFIFGMIIYLSFLLDLVLWYESSEYQFFFLFC